MEVPKEDFFFYQYKNKMNFLKNRPEDRPKRAQHSFQPVYYFSRFAGLWPFTIVYNSNGSIKGARVQLLDILWFLVSICFYFESLFNAMDEMKNSGENKIFFISNIPPLLFGPICIALDMFNRKSLTNILDKFITFDNEVKIQHKSKHTK